MNARKNQAGDFHFAEWPFYWLTRASDRYTQHLERALKQIELDIPIWRVLMQLRKGGYVSVSSIAQHALIKLPTMTKIINRMQSDGLVSCRTSLADARVTEVSITKYGLIARKEAWRQAQRIGNEALSGMSPTKLESLHQLLDHLFENLGPVRGKKPVGD